MCTLCSETHLRGLGLFAEFNYNCSNRACSSCCSSSEQFWGPVKTQQVRSITSEFFIAVEKMGSQLSILNFILKL